MVHTRCTEQEKNRWTAAAELHGSRLGPFSRKALDEAISGTVILTTVASGEQSATQAARELKAMCIEARNRLSLVKDNCCSNGNAEYADDIDYVTAVLGSISNKLG